MNSKITIGRSHRNLLVGRSSELETLRQLLFVPQRGAKAMLISQKNASAIPLDTLRKPQCMVVMGEAGIGKTRLAEETSREAHERGWAVTWSRSYAQESTIPYRLWIEIMRGLINSDPWQKQELIQHPLVYSRLTALLPELYDQLPGTTAAPSRQHPGQEQQNLWEAILELFELAIERTPMLVVLDDLQWADTSSCELLAYLVRRLSGFPIVFLGTCREIEPYDRYIAASTTHRCRHQHPHFWRPATGAGAAGYTQAGSRQSLFCRRTGLLLQRHVNCSACKSTPGCT